MGSGRGVSSVNGDKDACRPPTADADAGVTFDDARMPGTDRMMTPPEVARLLKVKPHKILAWIQSGELRAINVAAKLGGRPRYRVTVEDLRAFTSGRVVGPPPTVKRSPRRSKRDGFKNYF
ncbi:MAG: helix-turn-helix domain-containing protein [Planctomycetales bacterium]|nr:helix-turn-helix domain-containing protein [Planctomycetales bacterium]